MKSRPEKNPIPSADGVYESGWGALYDQYAAIIYGICLKTVGNENTAKKLFMQVYVECYKRALAGEVLSIPSCLIKHTYKLAFRYIKEHDPENVVKMYKLIRSNAGLI